MEIDEKELAELRRDTAKWRKVEEIATTNCEGCPIYRPRFLETCRHNECPFEVIVAALSEVPHE